MNSTFNICNTFFTNLFPFEWNVQVLTLVVGVRRTGETIQNSTENKNIFNICNTFFTNLFPFEWNVQVLAVVVGVRGTGETIQNSTENKNIFNPFNPVDLKRGRKFFSTSEKWKKFVFPCFAELFLCAFYLIPKPDFVLYKKTVEN